jgi:hypothetical protein
MKMESEKKRQYVKESGRKMKMDNRKDLIEE